MRVSEWGQSAAAAAVNACAIIALDCGPGRQKGRRKDRETVRQASTVADSKSKCHKACA